MHNADFHRWPLAGCGRRDLTGDQRRGTAAATYLADRALLVERIRPMAAPLADVYTLAIGMGIDEQQYLRPIAHALDRGRTHVEKL